MTKIAKHTIGIIIMFIVMVSLVAISTVLTLYLVAYMKNLGV
jgi:hypothetical protein